MGLDQYIEKTAYLAYSNEWGRIQKDEDYYFRKFNALHNWIFNNCVIMDADMSDADDLGFIGDKFAVPHHEDNVVYIPIKQSKWIELRDVLKNILSRIPDIDWYNDIFENRDTTWENEEWYAKNISAAAKVADETFPTTSGFFFGGTAYESYYFRCVKDLLENVEELLLNNKWLDNGLLDVEISKAIVNDQTVMERLDAAGAKREEFSAKIQQEHDKFIEEEVRAAYNKRRAELFPPGTDMNTEDMNDEQKDHIKENPSAAELEWNVSYYRMIGDNFRNLSKKYSELYGITHDQSVYDIANIDRKDCCTAMAMGYYAWY